MLVLSRKRGEKVVVSIGDQVAVLEVLDLAGGRVRLGVSAPPEVVVHRSEVWNRANAHGSRNGIATDPV
jgi:carbon storage regulator